MVVILSVVLAEIVDAVPTFKPVLKQYIYSSNTMIFIMSGAKETFGYFAEPPYKSCEEKNLSSGFMPSKYNSRKYNGINYKISKNVARDLSCTLTFVRPYSRRAT